MCNDMEKPWYMIIKTDDNTRYFADRCSFAFEKLPNKEIKKRLGGKVPTSKLPGK